MEAYGTEVLSNLHALSKISELLQETRGTFFGNFCGETVKNRVALIFRNSRNRFFEINYLSVSWK